LLEDGQAASVTREGHACFRRFRLRIGPMLSLCSGVGRFVMISLISLLVISLLVESVSSLALSITVDSELNSSLSELEMRGDWHSSIVAVEISSISQSGLLARPRSRGLSSFIKLLIVSLSLAGLSLNCEN